MSNKKTILVVDDSPEVLKVIVKILDANEDYNILQALSVDFALKIATSREVDLVVSDWEMPDKNGMDLINLFHKNQKIKDIPIIIVTGVLTKVEDLQLAFETGAIDFLRKPIEAIELISRVKSIMELKEYQRELLERKNRELALHAMYLLENKEKQIKFSKNLKEIIKRQEFGKKSVLNFIEQISLEMEGDLKRDTWKDFKLYFNQIHPNFTQRLTEKFEDLSAAEIRLSVFLRMNMNTQSIADALHISADSVKTARTRLRTKFNLDRKTNLTAFISSI